MKEISQFIDHTNLKATASEEDIVKLCDEAKKFNFFSVCVNSCYVPLAKKELQDSEVKICSVVGFPLGAMSPEAKLFETQQAIKDGADEVDMVINVGALKSGLFEKVENEIAALKNAIGSKILKVILETCYLTNEEITLASELAAKAKADFVKTSTGFGTGGATLEHVKLMKNAVAGKAEIKASGGIKSFETVRMYIDAGVERIGTSSGISIINESKK